jgi:pimeloyl-ACP methyl ester carboxylesterase
MAALFSRRAGRVTVALCTVLLFAVLAGVTYQSISNALERRRFLHPGRLVEIGNHQLHLYCVGERVPTVVLESPAGGMSMTWAWVQDELATTTRVCSYDRAGLGWSEAGDGRYNAMRAPDELRALLQRAGERTPLIIAGQEYGAALARLYAGQYPHDVAALVLVDDPAEAGGAPTPSWTAAAWPWLARVGLLRVTHSLSRRAAGLPSSATGAAQAFLNRPDHLTRAAREVARLDAVTDAARGAGVAEAIPVTHVTTGQRDPPVVLASREQAKTVTRALIEAVERARRH